jgi:hypothetical protein
MEDIREALENGWSIRNALMCSYEAKFDWKRMKEIKAGFENGLSEEQINLYANSKFDENQMYAIKKGFENGLSLEQIQIYAKPEFYASEFIKYSQMHQIRLGLEHGLTTEQVQTYAKSEYHWEQMQEMRHDLESHLSEITTHYKGELGEFDYNRSDFVLLKDKDGKDYLHYNEYIGNTTLDLPNGITNTRNMFKDCTLPDGFAFGDFDTSKVTDMSGMFENCSMSDGFTFGNGFDTRIVEDMSYMFNGCSVPDDFVFNDKFVINDNCIVDNMFEDSNIDDLSPLEEPDLEVDGEEI